MTYAQGGLIQASDYNGFATNINAVWATLYGQPAISAVSVGGSITAQQWNSIYNTTANAALHQGTLITSIPPVSAGDRVTYYSQLPTNITAIGTNRYNTASNGTDTFATGTRTLSWGAGIGIPAVSSTVTMTFDSIDKLRYFFNAGGRLRIYCSSAIGSGTADTVAWNQFCTAMGRIVMPAVDTPQQLSTSAFTGLTQFDGTITPNVYVREGYYNLTASPELLYQQTQSAPYYGTDTISIYYSTSGATVTATVVFVDSGNDALDGDLTVTCTARPGESTYITNTWGTPTITVTAPA